MDYRFATLDVFTGTRFAGNPLAVVFDADPIAPATMQAIAREFGHPETVFVLTPDAASSTAAIRIFTPSLEMPFAGHPTVGSALILALTRGGADGNILLEEKIGLVHCRATPSAKDRGHASFVLPQLPKPAGPPAPAAALAAALGLAEGDIDSDGFAPSCWSAGISFTFVPVRGLDAIRRCRVDLSKWDAAFERSGRTFALVFCRETVDPRHAFHARMFAPRAGVPEDPATGSAAAAFTGLCASALALADGEHRLTVEQGYEMGRPSLLELTLTLRDGSLAAASIGGEAVVVTEGTIEV